MKTTISPFPALSLAAAAACFLLSASFSRAQDTLLSYQGRVLDNGTNFNGTGRFKFALITGTNVNQTATATADPPSNGYITGYNVTFGGLGYASPPVVTITGGGGSGAAAHAIVSGGSVTSIAVDNTGNGLYTSAPAVTIAPPPANIEYTSFWCNNGVSSGGSEPGNAVNVPVSDGLFMVALGDTTLANMAALDASLFSQPNLQLRLWFSDGVNGFAPLDPPQNLTPAPYAVMAQSVAGGLGLTIQPNTYGAPNFIAGSPVNFAAPGVLGATIGGGGATNYYGGVCYTNSADGDFDTISGGANNTAGNWSATVSGGSANSASGFTATVGGGCQNTASAAGATVGGGYSNSASSSYATVGGGEFNAAANGSATIAGGDVNTASGVAATVGGGAENNASDNFATVGGGYQNVANQQMATVGGGRQNYAEGVCATVGGGIENAALGYQATVGGGFQNMAEGTNATVGGGDYNVVTGDYATVPGGIWNVASGQCSFAAGYYAQATNDGAFVWADDQNTAFGSTTSNQFNVRASGGARFVTFGAGLTVDDAPVLTTASSSLGLAIQANPASGAPNLIAGSPINFVAPGVVGATIGGGGATNYDGSSSTNFVMGDFGTVSGGLSNLATNDATVGGGWNNIASGPDATVGGGSWNIASGGASTVGGGNLNNASAVNATVAGGACNAASGMEGAAIGGGEWNVASGDDATVGGGYGNTASGEDATVGGGFFNIAYGGSATVAGGVSNSASGLTAFIGGGGRDDAGNYFTNLASGAGSVICGGTQNTASGSRSTVGGGHDNSATNFYATVPGGAWNLAGGQGSFAAGRAAQATNDGVFVWGDGSATTTAHFDNEFMARASGGFLFYTSSGDTAGAVLPGGGGSWINLSDRNAKSDLEPVDARNVLDKVVALPVTTWRYNSQDAGTRHIGPMAQDFKAAFGVGETDKGITTVDAEGVALSAIQGLNQKVESENTALRAENAELSARLEKLERIISGLQQP